MRISIVGLLVPYVFVFSPSLLLVSETFSWWELAGTILRLLAAIWMFASSLAGADPFAGRLSMPQRAIRFVVGAAAMLPMITIWPLAVAATLAIGFGPRLLKTQTSQGRDR